MKLVTNTVLVSLFTATLSLVSLAQPSPPDAAQESQTIAIVRNSFPNPSDEQYGKGSTGA